MQIYGPYRVSTPQATNATGPAQSARNAESANTNDRGIQGQHSATPVDQLDLSSSVGQANRLDPSSAIAGGGEIRIDRVADIRRQIADGTYETPEKLEAALDRLLDRFA